MHSIPTIFACYFVFFACFGIASRHLEKRNVIIYAPKFKVNYSFENWGIQHYLSAGILCGVLLLIGSLAFKWATGLDIRTVLLASYALIAASSITLMIIKYRLIEIYKKITFTVNTGIILLALYVTYKAAAMADYDIANYTTVAATNFPAAQKIITLCAAIINWVDYALRFILVVYVIMIIATFASIVLYESKSAKHRNWRMTLAGKPSTTPPDSREINIHVSLFVGFAYTILFPLAMIELLSPKKINDMVKDMIVETSFPLSPEICNLVPAAGSKMALISDGQAVLAIPDKDLRFRFVVTKCERSYEKVQEIMKELDNKASKIASVTSN